MRLKLLIILTLSVPQLVAGQTQTQTTTVIQQLLAMPAPTPRVVNLPEDTKAETLERKPEFFSNRNPPPDDAPLEDLLEYWQRWANQEPKPELTETVQQRLLDAATQQPELLPHLVSAFPTSELTAIKVKELYDKQTDETWREPVKKWLTFNSKFFFSDLLALVNKVKDEKKWSGVDNDEALIGLAKVDWQAAEPFLMSLLLGAQPRSKTLALTIFYNNAIREKDGAAEDRYRLELKEIASDRNAPGWSRDLAIERLSLTEWSGLDEWYLSLFSDETLLDLKDESTLYHPLGTLFYKDPDKWIPVMKGLVEGKNQTIRNNAAACLITFQNQSARRDALLPLLPWLSDPNWAHDNAQRRLRLIQSMGFIHVPESVPGLIRILENSDEEFRRDRSWAADALTRYKDPRAIPGLRVALTKENDEDDRRRIIECLIASGGFSDTEMLDALEAYGNKLATPEGRSEVTQFRSTTAEPLPLKVSIGANLARQKTVATSLVRLILARSEALKQTNPALAQTLLEVAHNWSGQQINLDLVQRISAGNADAATIARALERRKELRESVIPELQGLTSSAGMAPGIAAVLLDDTSLASTVLSSGSMDSKLGLLASARLLQMALPFEAVGALLQSKDKLLATAAESYLLAEDSQAARELLWAHHPNEAFITGWRMIDGYYVEELSAIGRAEEKLRAELVTEKGLVEIFALLAGPHSFGRVLRVYSDKAVFTFHEDGARYQERTVTASELANFKNYLATNNFSDRGPQIDYCHTCVHLEFVSLSKAKGRRLFSEGNLGGFTKTLIEGFDALRKGAGASTHYLFEKDIKGLELLYSDDNLVVTDVWKQGSDLRVKLQRKETDAELREFYSLNDEDDNDDEANSSSREQKRATLLRSFVSWRKLESGRAVTVISKPTIYSQDIDDSRFPLPGKSEFDPARIDRVPITANSIVLASNYNGLWRQTAGQTPIRINSAEGAYSGAVLTPDRKWVVVAKTDSTWSAPNYVVRFNLQTGREYRVDIPPADEFGVIDYLNVHGRVLLRRAKSDYQPEQSVGPDEPEYYLLDAETGKTQLVKGIFAPLSQEGERPLQPSANPDEFWAAIPDRTQNKTEIGRYNSKSFSFRPVLTLSNINFESMSMWIDEGEGKVYLVYNGQLLRFPLGTVSTLSR